MKLAYICAPYYGESINEIIENIDIANKIAQLVQVQTDFVPVTPHNLFPWLMDVEEVYREGALEADINVLEKCNVLIYDYTCLTPGMGLEIAGALEHGIPVLCAREIVNG